MKRYETYKDSGIQWVGEIPSHWDSNKLKFFADISTGTTPSTANEEYWNEATENWYTPADFNEGDIHLNGSSRKVSAMAFEKSACKVFKKNVVLVVGIGATLGKIGFSRVECSANQQINAIEFYDNVYPLFGAYYLSSLKEVMKSLASAATLAIMNQSVTGSIPFVCPTLAEQVTIAAFLDHKVGQIDATIAEKEQMLEDLKNYRSAIISEAVTKGLDKNVEMKDSGIEWMGRVPKHWKISKLKYIGAFDNGLTYSPEDVVEKGILVLRSSNIQNSHLSFDDCVYVKNAPSDLMVEDGDIIICSRNGSANLVGKCAFVDHIENSSFGAFMMRFRPCIHKKFAFYAFQASTSSYKGLYSTSTINQITKAVIDQMFLVVPPIEEQERIADYIDKKITNIDSSLTEVDSQIADLKSYKSALITEAVTGKIDLRDWKPKEEKV